MFWDTTTINILNQIYLERERFFPCLSSLSNSLRALSKDLVDTLPFLPFLDTLDFLCVYPDRDGHGVNEEPMDEGGDEDILDNLKELALFSLVISLKIFICSALKLYFVASSSSVT